MKKKEKWFYVMSGFVITMVLAIIICFTLVLTGVVSMPREIIEIKSASATKLYDGTPLTCERYEVSKGNLKEGHTIKVMFVGTRTQEGTSDNVFSVVITDAEGKNVTSSYQIIKTYGQLVVYD